MALRNISLGLTVALAALGVAYCDPRGLMYENFKKKTLAEQMAERHCPVASEPVVIDQSLQTLAVGPYALQYETNFLQIDAHHAHKRGQYEYIRGQRQPILVNRDWIQIHALAPDMVPNFWASSDYRRRQARGDLFLVAIELFWSEDGSWKPQDSERIGNLTGAEPPLAVRPTPIGLVEHELRPWSGWRRKFVPDLSHAKDYPFSLVCSGPYEPGAGNCYVVKQLRPDVWSRYSFGTENLRCWREIDGMVGNLLDRFTHSWERRVPSEL